MGNHSKLFKEIFSETNKTQIPHKRTNPPIQHTDDGKQLFFIDSRYITIEKDNEYNYSKDSYIIGGVYVLPGIKCEWGRMPGKEYVLKYVFKEISGVEVDIVIMKQISGKEGTIFCLSKVDCEQMGIPYEDGLQVFHKDMDFKYKRGQDVKIDFNDLSTYPINKKTLKIDNIHFLCTITNKFNPELHDLIANGVSTNGVIPTVTTQTKGVERVVVDMCNNCNVHTFESVNISLNAQYEKEELNLKSVFDFILFNYTSKRESLYKNVSSEFTQKHINGYKNKDRRRDNGTQSAYNSEKFYQDLLASVDRTLNDVEQKINVIQEDVTNSCSYWSENKQKYLKLYL